MRRDNDPRATFLSVLLTALLLKSPAFPSLRARMVILQRIAFVGRFVAKFLLHLSDPGKILLEGGDRQNSWAGYYFSRLSRSIALRLG